MKRFAGMLALALATGAQSQTQIASPSDVDQAATYLKTAAADFTNCRRASACKVYFDSFGVAIPFADGSIVPFSHVQRLSATSRECVKKAKALEEEGDRSLAVQWAMAARIESRTSVTGSAVTPMPCSRPCATSPFYDPRRGSASR